MRKTYQSDLSKLCLGEDGKQRILKKLMEKESNPGTKANHVPVKDRGTDIERRYTYEIKRNKKLRWFLPACLCAIGILIVVILNILSLKEQKPDNSYADSSLDDGIIQSPDTEVGKLPGNEGNGRDRQKQMDLLIEKMAKSDLGAVMPEMIL